MKRTIDQWKNCDPRAMANEQSDAAKMFAFQDAKADILELHDELEALRADVETLVRTNAHLATEDHELREENEALQTQLKIWKSNHATEVPRARILKERTTMTDKQEQCLRKIEQRIFGEDDDGE